MSHDGVLDALPLTQSGPRISRASVLLLLRSGTGLQQGIYDISFPITLPGEEPSDNVWRLVFCADAICSGQARAEFPLIGFSDGEDVAATGGGPVNSWACRVE